MRCDEGVLMRLCVCTSTEWLAQRMQFAWPQPPSHSKRDAIYHWLDGTTECSFQLAAAICTSTATVVNRRVHKPHAANDSGQLQACTSCMTVTPCIDRSEAAGSHVCMPHTDRTPVLPRTAYPHVGVWHSQLRATARARATVRRERARSRVYENPALRWVQHGRVAEAVCQRELWGTKRALQVSAQSDRVLIIVSVRRVDVCLDVTYSCGTLDSPVSDKAGPSPIRC
jgi:hypothetical protein